MALLACAVAPTARAQDSAYVVSYFETAPAAQAEAAALARAFAEASRKPSTRTASRRTPSCFARNYRRSAARCSTSGCTKASIEIDN
ncbi:MAG: hypothetical protein ABI547_11715 [Betaproteobacteria bacterium]